MGSRWAAHFGMQADFIGKAQHAALMLTLGQGNLERVHFLVMLISIAALPQKQKL